jgi:catechol 2,3-dioxygenase-like lactoylglutathione lyase family enzyme
MSGWWARSCIREDGAQNHVTDHVMIRVDSWDHRQVHSGVQVSTREGRSWRIATTNPAHQEWRSRGAEFLTPPKAHSREIRCYMRDPDGHLIEVGQTTGVPA